MPEKLDNIKLTRPHHSVLPEVETLISIETLPKATCFLVNANVKDKRLQLDADDNGMVRFHVKAHREWRPIEMHLEYATEVENRVGTRSRYAQMRGTKCL